MLEDDPSVLSRKVVMSTAKQLNPAVNDDRIGSMGVVYSACSQTQPLANPNRELPSKPLKSETITPSSRIFARTTSIGSFIQSNSMNQRPWFLIQSHALSIFVLVSVPVATLLPHLPVRQPKRSLHRHSP